MSDRHYDVGEMLEYLDYAPEAPGRHDLESHLGACIPCRRLFKQVSKVRGALNDPETWEPEEASGASFEPSPEKTQEFFNLMHQINEEDARAERHLPKLLAGSSSEWHARIDTSAEYRTLGIARALLAEFSSAVYREPLRALELASLATAVGNRLTESIYRHDAILDLRGDAYKDRANALRLLGRYDEALVALTDAERCFRQVLVCDFGLAAVEYVRATVFCALERYPEALEKTRWAAGIFLSFGDDTRAVHCHLLEAVILYHTGLTAMARDLFLELIEEVKQDSNLGTLAGLFNNLANCYRDLSEPDAAGSYYLQAIHLYQEMGMETEKTRLRFALGRMLVTTGRFVEGLAMLRNARQDFEAVGMVIEAGVVALHMAEAMLATGEPEEVPAICHALVDQFTSAGMPSNALTALAYLREAVATGRATPVVVRHVRQYLEVLPQRPELAFVAPQE